MSTATLYLRVPPELHTALVQEAAARCRNSWQRPNVQRVCIELLTDRLAQLAAERAPKPKRKAVRK